MYCPERDLYGCGGGGGALAVGLGIRKTPKEIDAFFSVKIERIKPGGVEIRKRGKGTGTGFEKRRDRVRLL